MFKVLLYQTNSVETGLMVQEAVMFNSIITATGSYLPDFKVSNDDLSEVVDTSDEWIYSRTGIKNRRIAKDIDVATMAANASKKALENGQVNAKDIDMIVVATVSSDYAMPSTACLVQDLIGADQAFCFDLQAACSGFVYGLDVIHQFIQTGKVKKALLIGVEKLSQLLDWSDRSTCVLFGDGAGAVVVESTTEDKGIMHIESKAIGKQWEALVAPLRNNDTPYYKQTIDPYLTMDGRNVFQFACTRVPEIFEEIAENVNLTPDDIELYVLHQANSRIIEKIAKKLKQPIDKFYMNMESYGNTSAATIPIALDELNQEGRLDGKLVGLSGFGAGLTYGATIIQF